jgi:hypothetical protein
MFALTPSSLTLMFSGSCSAQLSRFDRNGALTSVSPALCNSILHVMITGTSDGAGANSTINTLAETERQRDLVHKKPQELHTVWPESEWFFNEADVLQEHWARRFGARPSFKNWFRSSANMILATCSCANTVSAITTSTLPTRCMGLSCIIVLLLGLALIWV